MSEFGGIWKHQNNPACAKSVRAASESMSEFNVLRKQPKQSSIHALKMSSLQNVETGQDTEDERTNEEEAKALAFTIRCCNILLASDFFV